MSLIKTVAQLETWFDKANRMSKTLGLVPTMGYLHEGHLSLIREAKAHNDLVAVSIFVNPTQFAPGEDYVSYPRDIERDYKLASEAGADIVFNPDVSEIYISGSSTTVEVTGDLTKKLCGASRPIHFKGVATVVTMLFNIFRPDRAYFGQKDAQQALVIKKMVRDLHMHVEVIVCPIVREADGLARSSRNVFLSPRERAQAPSLNRALQAAEDYLKSDAADHNSVSKLVELIERDITQNDLAVIDYVQILDGETLDDIAYIEPGKKALAAVAIKFGKTRLIDNRVLSI
ncbi:MAG: pantoate--beta-alanine ligase [Oscillospiraceae bacterium]